MSTPTVIAPPAGTPAVDRALLDQFLNQANAVIFANSTTGIYGLSGAGKTSLIATAAEYNYETFGKITLYYSSDLGGWGNKLLSLIRLGIVRAWYVRNHINPLETIELATRGAWPAEILEPETGHADPSVPLIMPTRIAFALTCPNGHRVTRADSEAGFQGGYAAPCPTCGVVTSLANGSVSQVLVQHSMFSKVGMRAYDSMTQLCDWGMEDLQQQAAAGTLPTTSSGGSVLGAAEAVRSGSMNFSAGSDRHVGFIQNRTYAWIGNVRAIAGHTLPPVMTFGVEQGKAQDESGGVPCLGPKIAGNARTAWVPGWLGNMLHASREPNKDGNMVYRLWLVNHLDPRDPRQIPYQAKQRGEPWGIPDFLEDPYDEDKEKRDAMAWTVCSLKNFYQLQQRQMVQILARDAQKFPGAPALQAKQDEDTEVEVGVVTPGSTAQPVANQIRQRGRGLRASAAMPAAPAVPTPATAAPQTVTPPVATESPIAQQLQASLDAAGGGASGGTVTPPVGSGPAGASSAAPLPAAATTMTQSPHAFPAATATGVANTPPAAAPAPSQAPPAGRTLRRIPRPPTS